MRFCCPFAASFRRCLFGAQRQVWPGFVLGCFLPAAVAALWPCACFADPKPERVSQPVRIPGLAELHAKAEEARAANPPDFATVEQLRGERLKLLQKNRGKSAWTDGARAMSTADALCRKMKYRNAAEVLKKAWQPFVESSGRDALVLGDIALKMFEVQQAALAVYPPGHQEFPALSSDEVRAALQRAAAADPCQVEVRAAQAYLTRPNADESFQPAELQPSLVARNRELLGISYDNKASAPILPWHAAVEFLKAKSSSFVLDDLKYLDTFLDPDFRVQGTDRLGEPFCVVLGGGLLVSGAGREAGRSQRYVFDYEPQEKRWRRFRPLMLAIVPEGVEPAPWSLNEADLCGRLDAGLARVTDLVADAAVRDLEAIVARFPEEVARAVQAIRDGTWRDGATQQSGPAATAPLGEQLAFIRQQFGVYGTNVPKQRPAAVQAMEDLVPLIDALGRVTKVRDEIRELFVKEYGANGAPAPPRMLAPTSVSSAKLAEDSPTNLPRTLRVIAAAGQGISEVAPGMLELIPPAESPKGKKPPARRPGRDAPRRGLPGGPARPEVDKPSTRIVDGPSGEQVRLEVLKLLDELRFLVTTRALADQAVVSAIDAFFGEKSRAVAADDDGSLSGVRTVLGTAERAQRRVVETLREGQSGDISAGQTQAPLRLTASQTSDLVSAASLLISGRMFLGASPEGDADQRLRQFVSEGSRILSRIDLTNLLMSWRQQAPAVRDFKVAGCSWTFSELPEDMPLRDLAAVIDRGASLALAESVLLRMGETPAQTRATGEGGAEAVPLIPAATQIARNPLVDTSGAAPLLRLDPPRSVLPVFTVALLAEDDAAGVPPPQPAFDVDPQGRPVLWVDDRGRRLPLVLDTTSPSPMLSLEYSGVDGMLSLGIQPNNTDHKRALKDRRNNRISRQPPGAAGPFAIETQSGVRLTDKSVNHAWEEWRDVDRNIIDTFMPNALFLGPSLPVWMAYRSELTRPAPVPEFLWGVARPAFR